MMRLLSTILLVFTLSFSNGVFAEEAPKIKGKYEVIGDLSQLKNVKQIEIIEFFNFSCGHCYKFLTTSKRLHKKFKGKLFHKKSPIYWGQQTPYPAMAFYISDEQGIEKQFTQELFDTNFQMNINVFQPRAIKLLAKSHGIEKEMVEGMQADHIKAKVNKSLAMAKHFKANETPTIIINKTLKVTPSISGGDVNKMTDNLEVIFDDLLKK